MTCDLCKFDWEHTHLPHQKARWVYENRIVCGYCFQDWKDGMEVELCRLNRKNYPPTIIIEL